MCKKTFVFFLIAFSIWWFGYIPEPKLKIFTISRAKSRFGQNEALVSTSFCIRSQGSKSLARIVRMDESQYKYVYHIK